MLKINWAKIDKFYPIAIGVGLLLAVLAIFTFKTIFSTFSTAYQMEQPSQAELRINKNKLDEAYDFVFGKPQPASETAIKKE